MANLALAGLLLAHALIHVAYLAPRPKPTPAGAPAPWPFELATSWLLTPLGAAPGATRPIGLALIAITLVGFGLAALSALGVGGDLLWTWGVAAGAIGSLSTLVLYFHPWLVLGIAIDALLLWVIVVAGWSPSDVGL